MRALRSVALPACVLTACLAGVVSAAPPPAPPKPVVAAAPAKPQPKPATVEGIEFADPFLAAQFRRFLDAGEKAAPKDWNRSGLLELPAEKFRPLFYWQRWTDQPAPGDAMIWKAETRPSSGTIVTLRADTQSPKIGLVSLYGWSMPKEGWGAGVLYQCTLVNGALREELSVRTYAPDQEKLTIAPTLEAPLFRLTSARVYPKSVLRQHTVMVVPPTDLPGYWNTVPKGKLPLGLIGSEDEFLEAALANVADLEKAAKETIPAGTAHFTVVDYSSVRSDNPPRSAPVDERTRPDEERRKDLLADVLKALGDREARLRASSKEMSAAIRQAFPFRKDLEESSK